MLLPDTARVAAPYRLATGTELWRNHRVEYPGASFNPCEGEPTRFAPLRDAGGGCIPGFYASTTFDGAAYETVFREAPHRFRPVLRQELDRRGVSVLAPLRDLALVPLFTPELASWGIVEAELFHPDAASYPFCRMLAECTWRDNPSAAGLIWSSVRDSGSLAMVFFGGRVGAGDFVVRETRNVSQDPRLLDSLVTAGQRAGFRISR